MAFDNKKYQSKYLVKYVREHYVRKEIRFKTDEWEQLEKELIKQNKTIKEVLFDFANIKRKDL